MGNLHMCRGQNVVCGVWSHPVMGILSLAAGQRVTPTNGLIIPQYVQFTNVLTMADTDVTQMDFKWGIPSNFEKDNDDKMLDLGVPDSYMDKPTYVLHHISPVPGSHCLIS